MTLLSRSGARRLASVAVVVVAAVALAACAGGGPVVSGNALPAAPTVGAVASPRTAESPTGTDPVLSKALCPPAAGGSGAGQPASGTVYYDKNQNGVQDPGEPGLPDIPMFLANGPDSITPGEEKSPATCTDSSGHFSITPPDTFQGWRIEFRTGWFRTQCAGLTCPAGGAGDNVAAGPEWIYTDPFTGATPHTFDVGLVPDAGQYVVDIHAQDYSAYPPDLAKAHEVDLSARFTDDETTGCRTTTNGVSCHIGQTIAQTLYIANPGLTPVSGIRGVMQLPYGETHHDLLLLHSGSSPGITALSDVVVTPAQHPREKGFALTDDNFTTITFAVVGTLPPGGFISVMSVDTLASGTPGTQIIGHAGITAEDGAASDGDSAFCATPAIPSSCAAVSNTHSFLDLHGDDNDSDRFNVLA